VPDRLAGHGIVKFKESRRERFLSGEELERPGTAIREAENNRHSVDRHFQCPCLFWC
jgi:hypothetical protein